MRYDPLKVHQSILGQTFINALTDRTKPLLRLGKENLTKHELVMRFGTGNFLAARRLAMLMDKMKMKSVMEFFDVSPTHLAELHGVGITMLYVLICIGKERKVDIKKWYASDKTFTTMKHRARKEESDAAAAEKSQAAERTRERRRQVTRAGTRHLQRHGYTATGSPAQQAAAS